MRFWTAALMLLTACLSSGEEGDLRAADSSDLMMGGATMTLTTTEDWVGSLTVTVTVTDAPPNKSIRLMQSANLAGAGACPPPLNGLCLDLANPVTQLQSKKANAAGMVTFNVLVPDPVIDDEWEIQALWGGVNPEVSNAEIVTLHDSGSDDDADDLVAVDEIAAGTDLANPDTDGDLFLDGTEVTALTAPLDSVSFPFTWDDDIYVDLLLVECTPCHVNGGMSGGMNMDDYANVVNEPSNDVPTMDRIEPFDTGNSYLWHKVNGTQNQVGGAGKQMPRDGPPFLTADQLDFLEDWVNQGALEATDL
jgi:hypothetical protein